MKMGAGLFWGVLLIFIGIVILVKVIFRIDIPIGKILFGGFLIFIGIKILLGGFNIRIGERNHHSNDAIFNESYVEGLESGRREYNAIFGKISLDLRDIELTENTRIEVNAIFGGAEVLLNEDVPVKIKVDAAFGGAELPDGGTGGFGSSIYTNDAFDDSLPHLYIKGSAVFGGLEIKFR